MTRRDWQRKERQRERERDRDAINRQAGRLYKIEYDIDVTGCIGIFAYVREPHGGVWLRIAHLLKWVKNPRVVPL